MTKRSGGADRQAREAVSELLVRSGQGDHKAFADLFDVLAARVFGVVSCLVRDPVAAEAITREAFLEAWRRSGSYDPDVCSATAWTLLLAHRLAARARRLSVPASEWPTPHHGVDDSRLVEAGLSRAQVDAVQVAYFEGLHHLRIPAVVASDESGAALLADGLRILARSAGAQ